MNLIFLLNLTDGTDGWAIKYVDYYRATAGSANGLNVLGLILFCFVFGGVLASMVMFINPQKILGFNHLKGICFNLKGEDGLPMIKLFDCLNKASIRIIKLVMMISPFGIFSLILGTIAEMKDPGEIFSSISLYMVTVLTGLVVHGKLHINNRINV